MTNIHTSNNMTEEEHIHSKAKELLFTLQNLKRAKTEYEKTDEELNVPVWDFVSRNFNDLFKQYHTEYKIMKIFLNDLKQQQLIDFFNTTLPETNVDYLNKFIFYEELQHSLKDNLEYHKSKI